MANFNTLKEDIMVLVEELGSTNITSDPEFIITLIDKWSNVIANYLNTVIIVPSDALANFNSNLSEDESSIESMPLLNIESLKLAIKLGLLGIGLPVPNGFLPYFLNGIDAGHAFLVIQTAAQGVTALAPGPAGLQLRQPTETLLEGLLSTLPEDDEVRYTDIAIAIDTYTKLGTWTLPNGVTGNWS